MGLATPATYARSTPRMTRIATECAGTSTTVPRSTIQRSRTLTRTGSGTRLVELRDGGFGARRIAKALNLEGTNPRNGRAWAPEDVSRVLQRIERWEGA